MLCKICEILAQQVVLVISHLIKMKWHHRLSEMREQSSFLSKTFCCYDCSSGLVSLTRILNTICPAVQFSLPHFWGFKYTKTKITSVIIKNKILILEWIYYKSSNNFKVFTLMRNYRKFRKTFLNLHRTLLYLCDIQHFSFVFPNYFSKF